MEERNSCAVQKEWQLNSAIWKQLFPLESRQDDRTAGCTTVRSMATSLDAKKWSSPLSLAASIFKKRAVHAPSLGPAVFTAAENKT